MQELHTTIRAVSTELGDKVAEIQNQDRLVRDLQIQQASPDVKTSNQFDLFFLDRDCSLKSSSLEKSRSNHSLIRKGQSSERSKRLLRRS